MPTQTLPALNQTAVSSWTEQQQNLYNYTPFYLAKMTVNRRKDFCVWKKMTGRAKWSPNQGDIMKSVRKEPSPVIRQAAYPLPLSGACDKDIMDVREVAITTQVRHKKFESPVFQFYPSFRDFMKDHVEVHGKDIIEKQVIYEDMFLRSAIWQYAPFVYICNKASGGEIVSAPSGVGNEAGTATGSKTTAWIQNQLALIGNPGNLNMVSINMAVTAMSNDIGVPAFSGTVNSDSISKSGLGEKYILFTSAEAWNQFFFDPWILQYKSVNLNVLTEGFKGDLWGQVTCKLERWPMRFLADGTMPAPEIRVTGTSTGVGTANDGQPYNINETIPNPAYTSAPYEVAFMCGESGYDSIDVGPPPKAFASSGMPQGFGKMQWNGEVILSKALLIPYIDPVDSTLKYEANEYGEYVHFISHTTYGINPVQRRNVMPMLFKRIRGQVTA